ncbi:PAS domain S-box protein [Methanoculleus sp. Wushi-C6]|uniref:histidine kinase n=1 Tax=Methanoculleus caldifontis TaxID=2651577 RepID=A0ABU3WZV7_9EURY|nr:PAS domain S-box protein [Methanoculleus sp. Wushi-C6]MDV2481246.1 PAS domain S-box protein [Methanoculleus sp. Wushi-C6]
MYHCFDELDDAVIILNRDSTVAWLNRSFEETFGIANEAVRGDDIGDFVARLAPSIQEEGFAGRMVEALRCWRQVSHATCRVQTPAAGIRWFSFSCRAMTGEHYAGKVLATFRDVTAERDEAVRSAPDAAARTRAESVYAGIGETIPYGIWICEPDGAALYISSSLLDLAGATLEECRSAGWIECIPLKDAAGVLADWKHCLESGCRWDRELEVGGPGGGYRTILSRGAPIRDDNGRIVLWAGINLDITGRKQAEGLIAVRAAQQAAIAALGRFALAGAEPSDLMDAAVSAVAEHLGVEYAKVLRYLPDEDAFLLEAAVGFNRGMIGMKKVEGGTDSQAGYTLLSHEPVIVEDLRTEARFSGPPLLRDEGIVSGISVIIQGDRAPYGVLGAHTRACRRFTRDDINFVQAAANILAQGIERRAAEEALLASEEKFRAIAQRSFDMIYTCYHDGGITYMSPAVTRILGYTPEELNGRRCREYLSPVSLSAWGEAQKKLARGESVEGLEVEFRRKDGSVVFVELNESPILEHGKVVGVQAVGRDITERKQNEQLRRQAFWQIERNIEQFAVLGDHIRQPLQVTLGRAELLDDAETAAVIREQVERINDYIRQLDRGWVESRKVREFLRRHDTS